MHAEIRIWTFKDDKADHNSLVKTGSFVFEDKNFGARRYTWRLQTKQHIIKALEQILKVLKEEQPVKEKKQTTLTGLT